MSYRLTGSAIFLVVCAISKAGTVDITSSEFVTLAPGATVEFGFNIASFAKNSGSYNPYPTSLSFQILGEAGIGQPSANVPGSSQQYDPQFLLDAVLTSADGNASVPLVDSTSTRLGLKSGSMVVTTGAIQGSQSGSLNMMNASVQLSPQESALIFGSNIASASDMAFVVVHNDGPAIDLGIGAGYDLQAALMVSGVTGAGPVSTGGITEQVNSVTAAPEPRTYANFAGGFAILAAFSLLRRHRNLQRVSA